MTYWQKMQTCFSFSVLKKVQTSGAPFFLLFLAVWVGPLGLVVEDWLGEGFAVLCRPARGEPWLLGGGEPEIERLGLGSAKDSPLGEVGGVDDARSLHPKVSYLWI